MKDFGAFWIPIGAGIGVAFGVVFDNIPLGIAFGAAAGVVLGAIQGLGPSESGDEDDSVSTDGDDSVT